MDRETLVLLLEGAIEVVEGSVSAALAPMLNGRNTVSEIITHAGLDVLPAIYGIDRLRALGFVSDDDSTPHAGVPRELLETRVDVSLSVSVLRAGNSDAETFESLLRLRGIRVVEDGQADFRIAVIDDPLRPELESLNRRALDEGRPWMLVRPAGSVVWIGPVFEPGRTACWSCLAMQMRAARAAWRVPESLALPLSDSVLPPAQEVASSLAAIAIARWVDSREDHSVLLTFDLVSHASRMHTVLRRHDCHACGPDLAHQQPVPPERFVSPLLGIVHSVERAQAAGPLHVYVARHNFVTSPRAPHPDKSYGKGVTEDDARTGALCEALERYCGVFRGDEPLVRASLRELGAAAIHPNHCLGFSERQYAEREEWNRSAPALLRTPERFDEEAAIDWAPAWSLTKGETRYVAAAHCYYGDFAGSAFCDPDSNGCAAGKTMDAAILHGLLELVERDAVALWWYSRAKRPAVAIRSDYDTAVRREYESLNRSLCVLDLTTDLGIPVCAAVSAGPANDLLFGFGAHFDPVVAYTRALSELNQSLVTMLQYGTCAPFTGALEDRSFLGPSGSVIPSTGGGEINVAAAVELLRGHGLEMLVVDQTRAEIGLPVVRVIVPGLRHFWRRLGPGRLYDVPARLGWVERPLREEDLNPSCLIL